MNLTEKELYTLQMVLKTEILETEDLIKELKGNDKKELKEYLKILNSITNKLK